MTWQSLTKRLGYFSSSPHCNQDEGICIAVFPILADIFEVKTGSWSTAYWRIHFTLPNGRLRANFAQLITLLDIDGIGQNSEHSNKRF